MTNDISCCECGRRKSGFYFLEEPNSFICDSCNSYLLETGEEMCCTYRPFFGEQSGHEMLP